MARINVLNREVAITQIREDDYICLTDIENTGMRMIPDLSYRTGCELVRP